MTNLRHRATLVESLGSAVRSSDAGFGSVPGLLRQILVDEAWREFVTQLGEHVEHDSFAVFVETAPLKGLGADVNLVRRIVSGDVELLDLLDRALQNPTGLHNVQAKAPTGNRETAALRRLRKDRPDLHERVIGGEFSPHAAMVKAGFRPRTVTVRTDRPDSIAQTLRRSLTDDQIVELVRLLEKGA